MNVTANVSCLNVANCSDFAGYYEASGVLHFILVVLPVLVIGPVVLGIFISNKKLRDPISILYMCTATMCIIGPLTYGLLMDFSLITTVEVFGSCDSKSPRIFWILIGIFQSQLLAAHALLSSVQYATIRWGKNKVSTRVALGFFVALLLTLCVANMIHLIGATGTEQIRGSYCRHPGPEIPFAYALVTMFSFGVFTVPPVIVVVVCSILTTVYIKQNTIENSHSVKAVLKVVVTWTFSVVFLRFFPFFVIFLAFNTSTPISIIVVRSWYGIYSIELSNPLFLLLILFIHKTCQETFLNKVRKIRAKVILNCKKLVTTNQITPDTLSGSDCLPPVQVSVSTHLHGNSRNCVVISDI